MLCSWMYWVGINERPDWGPMGIGSSFLASGPAGVVATAAATGPLLAGPGSFVDCGAIPKVCKGYRLGR